MKTNKGHSKFRGRLGFAVFFGTIFLINMYKFEINQSDYLFEAVGVCAVLLLGSLGAMSTYVSGLMEGESF